jgi:hypothetical protein
MAVGWMAGAETLVALLAVIAVGETLESSVVIGALRLGPVTRVVPAGRAPVLPPVVPRLASIRRDG